MNKLPRAKKHIDNVVKRIKATNQAREEKGTDINEPDKDTDYANIITIKKADPQQTKPHENNSTQQSTITPQPQHSSTPIHQNNPQHQQTAEHDSTYDIENEQQTDTYTATKHKKQPQNTHVNIISATKTSEQSPISSLKAEDTEELDKLIFD